MLHFTLLGVLHFTLLGVLRFTPKSDCQACCTSHPRAIARRAALYTQERLRAMNVMTTAKHAVLYAHDLQRVTNVTTTAPWFSNAVCVCLCNPHATLHMFMLVPGGPLLHHPRLRAIEISLRMATSHSHKNA